MFRGRHIIRMEERGRFSLPARIREILNVLFEGRIVLSCGFFEKHKHLLCVPVKEWEKFEASAPFGGDFDFEEENFLARVRTIGSCEEIRIDEHGRVLVPEFMRSYAGLGKEVALVGMGGYLALFSLDTLEQVDKGAEKNLPQLRSRLARNAETKKAGTITNP